MKKVPCCDKEIMNVEETLVRYELSNRKFRSFLRQDDLLFILMYHKRKLIVRGEFEVYLGLNPNLLEEMKNAHSHGSKETRPKEPHIAAR